MIIGILFILIYLSGCIASATLLKEVARRGDLKIAGKFGLCAYLLIFSWIGYFTYTLTIKVILNRRAAKRS